MTRVFGDVDHCVLSSVILRVQPMDSRSGLGKTLLHNPIIVFSLRYSWYSEYLYERISVTYCKHAFFYAIRGL
jgi:hypothetical protein